VRIRFASSVAKYVQEHRWHHSERITLNGDGSLLVELELAALEEVKAWILSFGAKAVVESPAELQEMLRQDLLHLMQHYCPE
jgi:proteasome accessory factor B